jgi:hypothetical protein
MRHFLLLVFSACLASCGADPSANLTVPGLTIDADAKTTAACIHTAIDGKFGAYLRTEDLSFKGEYRFAELIPLTCIAGIGNCGVYTPWSISVVTKSKKSAVFLNAQEPYRARLLEYAGHCLGPGAQGHRR